jgi:hypothetical protein
MDLDEHLLGYEETPEHIFSLFDYISHAVKSNHTGKCQIYLILNRMGFKNSHDCTRKVRQCRAICKQCYKLRNACVNIILTHLNYRDGELAIDQRAHEIFYFQWSYDRRRYTIPSETSLNKYDPRCGRVPLARDIVTGFSSLGLYRSCDRARSTILGCVKHTCIDCLSYVAAVRELIFKMLLPSDILGIICKYTFQRVKVGTHICVYTDKCQIAASAIYGVCPLQLLPCSKLVPDCIGWVTNYSQVCDICMQWRFRETFYTSETESVSTYSSHDGDKSISPGSEMTTIDDSDE